MTTDPFIPFKVSDEALNEIKDCSMLGIGPITLHVGQKFIDGAPMGLCVTVVGYGKHPSGYRIFNLSGIKVSISPSSLKTMEGREIIVQARVDASGELREVMCLSANGERTNCKTELQTD